MPSACFSAASSPSTRSARGQAVSIQSTSRTTCGARSSAASGVEDTSSDTRFRSASFGAFGRPAASARPAAELLRCSRKTAARGAFGRIRSAARPLRCAGPLAASTTSPLKYEAHSPSVIVTSVWSLTASAVTSASGPRSRAMSSGVQLDGGTRMPIASRPFAPTTIGAGRPRSRSVCAFNGNARTSSARASRVSAASGAHWMASSAGDACSIRRKSAESFGSVPPLRSSTSRESRQRLADSRRLRFEPLDLVAGARGASAAPRSARARGDLLDRVAGIARVRAQGGGWMRPPPMCPGLPASRGAAPSSRVSSPGSPAPPKLPAKTGSSRPDWSAGAREHFKIKVTT